MSCVILPFALWPEAEPMSAAQATALGPSALPRWRHWWLHARRVSVHSTGTVDQPSLSLPHEQALAAAKGWPLTDGLLPWAAEAALQQGLAQAGDGSAWGWLTLCHWQVSHGQATLTDPADLQLDEATDQALFTTMQPFFAEDGIALHRWQPGLWLAQSPTLAQLPTASLERVMGEDVDRWLVGGESPGPEARLWRRLQNEMQMLLYTHAVNAARAVTVNSFWLHGTGALPLQAEGLAGDGRSDLASEASMSKTVPGQALGLGGAGLRAPALRQDFAGWCKAWQALDAQLDFSTLSRLVLCGPHEIHTYEAEPASWWRRLQQRFAPTPWSQVLAESASSSKGVA